MKIQAKKTSIQIIKYGIVGISNSLLTLIVIFICNDLLHLKLMLADVLGYVVGLINSFIWNKKWVFESHNKKVKHEIMLFLTGFGICFALQFITVWALISFTCIKGISLFGLAAPNFGEYIAICMGMGVYTIGNYLYNRFITFRS